MKKVIFDTDLGIDDAMALLYLHFSPLVDLVGICTGVGNASVDITTRNCLYMKERFGISAQVCKGASHGLNGGNPLPAPDMIHGRDGLGNIGVPDVSVSAQPENAAQFIADTILASPGEITVITVGRLTNLAIALENTPQLAGAVKEVVVMGGATGRNGHSGNVSPVAEANVYGDPAAADRVFCADMPVTMVGLDVSQEVIMDQSYFRNLKDKGGEAGDFIFRISRLYTQFYKDWVGVDGCYVHDASACIYAARPELFDTERGSIRVQVNGVAAGQTIFSPSGKEWFTNDWNKIPEQQMCTAVNADAVLTEYFNTLTRNN